MSAKKTIRFVLILIPILVVTGILYYTFRSNPDTLKGSKPSYSLLAEIFVSEFEEDEAGASLKYVNQVILLEGKIVDISKNKEGRTIINLEGSLMGNVSCLLGEKVIVPESYSIGGQAKIKGRCEGFTLDVVMTQCSIEN